MIGTQSALIAAHACELTRPPRPRIRWTSSNVSILARIVGIAFESNAEFCDEDTHLALVLASLTCMTVSVAYFIRSRTLVEFRESLHWHPCAHHAVGERTGKAGRYHCDRRRLKRRIRRALRQ